MSLKISHIVCGLVALAAIASPAFAHVTLEVSRAPVGASYKAILRVPHGCGAAATKVLKVQVPEGFIGVKPMPKAGWTLATVTAKYARTYEANHAQIAEGVREISWSGPGLPNDQYDEFVFVGTLASDLKPDTTLYFPTVQECDGASERWIEIPAAGKSAHDLKSPAPHLDLLPPAAR